MDETTRCPEVGKMLRWNRKRVVEKVHRMMGDEENVQEKLDHYIIDEAQEV